MGRLRKVALRAAAVLAVGGLLAFGGDGSGSPVYAASGTMALRATIVGTTLTVAITNPVLDFGNQPIDLVGVVAGYNNLPSGIDTARILTQSSQALTVTISTGPLTYTDGTGTYTIPSSVQRIDVNDQDSGGQLRTNFNMFDETKQPTASSYTFPSWTTLNAGGNAYESVLGVGLRLADAPVGSPYPAGNYNGSLLLEAMLQ